MQIVIDIPIEQYNEIVYNDVNKLREIIKNGTPLPKGHGRLIDANKVMCFRYCICGEEIVEAEDIRNAQTIIEADKEE